MTAAAPYSLTQLVAYFLKLGSIGFGGPVALVGHMYRELVEVRRWISAEDCKEGLALAQLMPGPLAAQLAIYLWTKADSVTLFDDFNYGIEETK